MYLKKLHLKNIKCFEEVSLEFPHHNGDYSGWNVILGVNASGKSTTLKAIAIGVLNIFQNARIARDNRFATDQGWVRDGQTHGLIKLNIQVSEIDHPEHAYSPKPHTRPELYREGGHCKLEIDSTISRVGIAPKRVPNRETDTGWLATGYGPFRRLARSGSSEYQIRDDRRFVGLFDDKNELTEFFDWLPQIYTRSIDRKLDDYYRNLSDKWYRLIVDIVNCALDDTCRIADVNSQGVLFQSIHGSRRYASDLSDGYRAFLAIVVDLIHHYSLAVENTQDHIRRNGDKIEVMIEGIVLIDEADAHLHPRWQRELGRRLCQVFPKIQFIVTTHSPFIAQEATDGGLFVLKATDSGAVTVEQPVESVRGWTASQILTGPLFGLDSTRDPETEEKIRESAALNAKQQGKTKLTAAEKKRLTELRKWLTKRLTAPGETYDEMRRQEDMARYVDATLNRLKNGDS